MNIRIFIDDQGTNGRVKPFRLRVMKLGNKEYFAQYYSTRKEAENAKNLIRRVVSALGNGNL